MKSLNEYWKGKSEPWHQKKLLLHLEKKEILVFSLHRDSINGVIPHTEQMLNKISEKS